MVDSVSGFSAANTCVFDESEEAQSCAPLSFDHVNSEVDESSLGYAAQTLIGAYTKPVISSLIAAGLEGADVFGPSLLPRVAAQIIGETSPLLPARALAAATLGYAISKALTWDDEAPAAGEVALPNATVVGRSVVDTTGTAALPGTSALERAADRSTADCSNRINAFGLGFNDWIRPIVIDDSTLGPDVTQPQFFFFDEGKKANGFGEYAKFTGQLHPGSSKGAITVYHSFHTDWNADLLHMIETTTDNMDMLASQGVPTLKNPIRAIVKTHEFGGITTCRPALVYPNEQLEINTNAVAPTNGGQFAAALSKSAFAVDVGQFDLLKRSSGEVVAGPTSVLIHRQDPKFEGALASNMAVLQAGR